MVTISLGMPATPPPTADPAWRTAWDAALYGPEGFFRRHRPAEHFRTAVHDSDLVARALLRLLRLTGLESVHDVGAGGGELLAGLHRLDPGLQLQGIEVGPRPPGLPPAVGWASALPERLDGLVVAHEWLDNIPCHVVQVDTTGVVRLVHVDPATGQESLGLPVNDPGVPPALGAWLRRWWPLGDSSESSPVGGRAEIGTTRDRAWADLVRRLGSGLVLAVDYGHTRAERPGLGSLRSYRGGRQVAVVPDGSCDITADVAVDAVAASTGAQLLRQREALATLGVDTARPPVAMAEREPVRYLHALSQAGLAAELTAPSRFGDYSWVVQAVGDVSSPFTGG